MTLAGMLAMVLVAAPPPRAPAYVPVHGEGVLTADRGTMAPGEKLKLTGASFDPSGPYRIKLTGALQEFTLVTVRPRPDSTFSVTADIPLDARVGAYRLEVVAEDGDVSAALDVTLVGTPTVAASDAMDAMPGMDGPMARADEIPIERPLSGAGWAVIGLLVGLSAGLGIGLLWRPSVAE